MTTWIIVCAAIAEIIVGIVEWYQYHRGPSRREMRFQAASRLLPALYASSGTARSNVVTYRQELSSIAVGRADALIAELESTSKLRK